MKQEEITTMDCEKFTHLLVGYADGSLSEPDGKNVERHLSSCEKCRAELDSVKSFFNLAREIKVPEFPETFWKIQYNNLMETWNEKKRVFIFSRILKRGVGFLFVLIAVFMSVRFFPSGNKIALHANRSETLPVSFVESQQYLPLDEMVNYVDYADRDTQKLIAEEVFK